MKKRAYARLLLLLVAVVATACGQGQTAGSAGGAVDSNASPTDTVAPTPTRVPGVGPIDLLALYINDEFSAHIDDWVAEFLASNPSAEVSVQVMAEDELADFFASAEELPDLMLIPADYLPELQDRGLLNTDLPALVQEELGAGKFYAVPEGDTVGGDGAVLGLPYYGAVQGIWYRLDLFEEAGLEAPDSLENIRAAAEALHNPSASVYGIALPQSGDGGLAHHALEQLALGAEAMPIAEDGSPRFGDAAFVEVLQLYEDLTSYMVPAGTSMAEARDLFLDEQLAMIIDSTSFPQELANRSEDIKIDEMARKMGFVAGINDTAEDGSTTYAYTLALGVASNANEDTAHALISYLYDEAYTIYWIPQGWAPAWKGFAMQWRAQKAHDWFGYYEQGMPEDLLHGLRKSVRWNDAGDAVALTSSRVYAAGLFSSAADMLLVEGKSAAQVSDWLQEQASGLE